MKEPQDTAIDAATATSIITLSLADINVVLTFCGLVIAIPIAVFRLLLLIRQWQQGRRKS